MTNTETTPVPTAVPFDPRPDLLAVLAGAGAVIATVTADDHARPTPCESFDVEALVAHLVLVANRIDAVGSGRPALSVGAGDDLIGARSAAAAWDEAAAAIAVDLVDDGVLSTIMSLPFADLPGFAALGIYTSEVLTHTWDLATALGLDRDWDQAIAGRCLALMEQALPVEGRDGPEIPFGAVVATDDDAPAIDRLVAFVGRRPDWTQAPATADGDRPSLD